MYILYLTLSNSKTTYSIYHDTGIILITYPGTRLNQPLRLRLVDSPSPRIRTVTNPTTANYSTITMNIPDTPHNLLHDPLSLHFTLTIALVKQCSTLSVYIVYLYIPIAYHDDFAPPGAVPIKFCSFYPTLLPH